MTDEEFERLAQRVEPEFQKNPARYRAKVALLGALGYGYLFLIAGSALGLAALLVWLIFSAGFNILALKLVIPLAALGIAVLRALWVEFPEPDGVAVTPQEAPALYALVNSLADKARAPRPDRILLSFDCNAAMNQRPRLGPLGFYERTLILGIPLLGVLTPSQATAVLAHELGHIAGGQARFGSWVVRIHTTWHQLDEELQRTKRIGAGLIRGFMEWYAPYFGAFSQVIIRQHEFAADRFAASLVGGLKAMADALVAVNLRQAACDEIGWQSLWQGSRTMESPPKGALRYVLSRAQEETDPHWSQDVLERRMVAPQLAWSTHPPLKARLQALGMDPDHAVAPPSAKIEQSALQHVLGEPWLALVDRVDEWWQGRAAFSWRKNFVGYQKDTSRVAELNDLEAREGKLALDFQWERANRLARAEGAAVAEPLLLKLLAETPDHAGANYALGGILLARNDPAGIPMLERAATRDAAAAEQIRGQIALFWKRQGKPELAEAAQGAAKQAAIALAASRAERRGFRAGEGVLPHELDAEALRRLQILLGKEPQVIRAWLGKKAVRFFPEQPYYGLVVELDGWLSTRKRNAAAIQELVKAHGYPGPTWICVAEGGHKWLRDALRKIPGSQVFDRNASR